MTARLFTKCTPFRGSIQEGLLVIAGVWKVYKPVILSAAEDLIVAGSSMMRFFGSLRMTKSFVQNDVKQAFGCVEDR